MKYNSPSQFNVSLSPNINAYKSLTAANGCIYTTPIAARDSMLNPVFSIPANKKMVFSAWVHEDCSNATNGGPCYDSAYTHNQVQIHFNTGASVMDSTFSPSGPVIDGWQRYEGYFTVPTGASSVDVNFINNSNRKIYFDDIRLHPFNANMKSYVYDPVNLRLVAELDENNYASFYEYDEEGTLVRTKAETREGIKTITETRSAKQKKIIDIQ